MSAPRIRKGYVDTPVGQVHYRELGEGPPLLLLHQTAWSSLQFRNAMPHLAARGLRAIAIDTPGFGLSDGFDHPPTVADYAANLPHVMDGLGLKQAAVCGHHTGASIAATFAARHPHYVSRLVLHGTPLYTAEERAERLARPHFDQTPQEDGSHLQKRFQNGRRVMPTASLEAIHWSVMQFFWAGPQEWHGHHAVFSHDLAPDLEAIRAPTLILSNTGDSLHPIAARVLALRPDFAQATLQGGTFHVVFDEAEAWARIVANYVLDGRP